MTHNLYVLHSVSKNSHSTATGTTVRTYFPPVPWLHLNSVSNPLPQPPGQSTLLRFTSESVWPRPGVQPRIQNNISPLGARHWFQTSSRRPGFQCGKRRRRTLPPICISNDTDVRDSVLDQFMKPNLCFMDSLSSLTQVDSLSLFLSFYRSISLKLSAIPPSFTSLFEAETKVFFICHTGSRDADIGRSVHHFGKD